MGDNYMCCEAQVYLKRVAPKGCDEVSRTTDICPHLEGVSRKSVECVIITNVCGKYNHTLRVCRFTDLPNIIRCPQAGAERVLVVACLLPRLSCVSAPNGQACDRDPLAVVRRRG